ncbi:MAG: hypothetical protein GXO74_10690 [Calditrichaeota bacterium]|nr:hypothetical protein [Calditrichota bacterium]
MNKKLVELLYRSFDAPLSASEQKKLEKALEKSEALRREREKIVALRKKMAAVPAVTFRPFFAERVLNSVKAPRKAAAEQTSVFDFLVAAFKPLAIAAVILLVSLMFYNLRATKNYTLAGALGKEPVSLEQIVDPVYAMELE